MDQNRLYLSRNYEYSIIKGKLHMFYMLLNQQYNIINEYFLKKNNSNKTQFMLCLVISIKRTFQCR